MIMHTKFIIMKIYGLVDFFYDLQEKKIHENLYSQGIEQVIYHCQIMRNTKSKQYRIIQRTTMIVIVSQ